MFVSRKKYEELERSFAERGRVMTALRDEIARLTKRQYELMDELDLPRPPNPKKSWRIISTSGRRYIYTAERMESDGRNASFFNDRVLVGSVFSIEGVVAL